MQKKKLLNSMVILSLFFVTLAFFSGCSREVSNENNQNEKHIVVAKAENKKEEVKTDASSEVKVTDNKNTEKNHRKKVRLILQLLQNQM